MKSIPVEVVYLIARHIDPNPLVYARLAGVSRSFYQIFTSDKLWGYLNLYGASKNIYLDWLTRLVAFDTPAVSELQFCWSPESVGSWIQHPSTNEALFGAIVHGLNITPTPVINDLDFMKALLKLYPGSFRYASPELTDNEELVLEAVTINSYALGYASERLRNQQNVCTLAVQIDPWCLEQASPQMRANRGVVLQAVQRNGRVLKYASNDLKDDEALVSVAIAQDGSAIKFASDRLKNDFALALKAVEQSSWGWLGVSSEIQDDKTVIEATVANAKPHDWQLIQEVWGRTDPSGRRRMSQRLMAASRSRARTRLARSLSSSLYL